MSPAPGFVPVIVPQDAKPGETVLEINNEKDGELALVRIPQEAKPGDELFFHRGPNGKLGCRIVKKTKSYRKESSHNESRLTVVVPPGFRPGAKLQVDLGDGEKAHISAPEKTNPGDRLLLLQDTSGKWQCQALMESFMSADSTTEQQPNEKLDPICCEVPVGATPGKTRLQVEGHVPGASLLVTVPDHAQTGDTLRVEQDILGNWCVSVLPKGANVLRSMDMKFKDVDSPEASERLISMAQEFGAFINPKLVRAVAPPLNILGFVATEPIEANEELIRMPAELLFTLENCMRVMPELYEAVESLTTIFPRRRQESAQAACLCALLQHQDQTSNGTPSSRTGPFARALTFWDAYAEVLLGEPFLQHPYIRALNGASQLLDLTSPSKEGKQAVLMAGDVCAIHRSICTGVDKEVLGSAFDIKYFMQARLAMLTRIFQSDDGPLMVPVTDFFNHGEEPGALYEMDGKTGCHVITAMRAHAVGEEVLTSYGKRSNVLLMRTYGFTLHPRLEPSWTFVIQSDKPPHIYKKYLPPWHHDQLIQLETNFVEDSLVDALNACNEHGEDATAFLRELCGFFKEQYEKSPTLEPALRALEQARALDVTSANWWDHFSLDDAPKQDTLGRRWAQDALCVKMSEYLCLTAHLEVIDLAAGAKSAEQCLRQCAHLRSVLPEALAALTQGVKISLNTELVSKRP